MKYNFLCFLMLVVIQLNSQVVIDSTSLPEVGDVLTYQTFLNYEGTIDYKTKGQDQVWDFGKIYAIDEQNEEYLSIEGDPLATSFPDANMLIDLDGFAAAGIRDSQSISIKGVDVPDLLGIGIMGANAFNPPFTLRQTPFALGDKLEDKFDVRIQFTADLIPGLDTIQLPLPGATLDSIRVIVSVFKTEEAGASGELMLNGQRFDVLRVDQIDSSSTKIEAGLRVGNFVLWLDVTSLFSDLGGNGIPDFSGRSTRTYKFLANGRKESILEINESTVEDTSGMSFTVVNGRMANDVISSIDREDEITSYIKVYPNPATSVINIEPQEEFGDYQVSIFDHSGKEVAKLVGLSGQSKKVSTEFLTTGSYFIRIMSMSGKLSHQEKLFITK